MEISRFETPVTVSSGTAPDGTAVSSAREAMDYLLNSWRGKRGPKHREALQACHDAVSGEKSATTARRSFVAAAREAGVLMSR